MKKKLFISNLILVVLFIFSGSKENRGEKFYINKKLLKKWETTKELKTPESVYYDKDRKILYISNIEGKPLDKDGKGFISKLSLEGKIKKLHWINGLNAPKGMGVWKGRLYVTDIDYVAMIDIGKGRLIKKYPAEGAKFLNDIAIDRSGTVYISDMTEDKIYTIKKGKIKIWLDTAKLNNPNGLFFEKENLLVGTNGKVLRIDIKTKKITDYIKDTGRIDGLVADGKGNYIISDWLGNVHLISKYRKKIKLLDTTSVKMNAADIEFIIDKRLLLIPTFFDDRVFAYRLK